jgi:polysaccharide biosynthesis/export protein
MTIPHIFTAFFSLGLFLLTSCSGPYLGKNIYGAEEFVLDSYKIKQGKFSILELEGKPTDELADEYLAEYEDSIHEGDILRIIFYHPKRHDLAAAISNISSQNGFQVIKGKIMLPDLAPICLEGLTLDQASNRIKQAYRNQIDDVEIFVSYIQRNIRKVELAGLVQVPSVPVDGKIRLFDVLAVAKVPPEANLFKSYLIRDQKPLPVDLYKLLKLGDMSQNVVMRGGDKIYIAEPSAASIMVMGEVGKQQILNVPAGFISLREALAAAHGIPFTGDKSYIQIIRGNIVSPKIYTVSWEHVIHLPNDSLLLMPGDVVYVASKPITEWNRFISQLLPSFTTVDVIGNTCKGWVWP